MSGNRTQFGMRMNAVNPWTFLGVFLLTFFVISVFLVLIDFIPEPPHSGDANVSLTSTKVTIADEAFAATVSQSSSKTALNASGASDVPIRIVIPTVGIDTKVVNPASADIKALDDALMQGAVRYPTSATLAENAGMLVFGHQSRLPVVKNQAFKAFANLQNVKAGEEILVYSGTAVYRYRVVSVDHVSALDGRIEFAPGKRTLVLSTCDSFGEKTDRYVVTAEFVSTAPLN